MFNFKSIFSNSAPSIEDLTAKAARQQAELDYAEAAAEVRAQRATEEKARLKELERTTRERYLGELNRERLEAESNIAKSIGNIKAATSKIEQHKSDLAARALKIKNQADELDSL